MSSLDPITIDELTARPLPIFGHSVQAIRRLRSEATVPWEKYGDIILKDPGLTLQTLMALREARGPRHEDPVTSMEQGAMLLGLARVQQLPDGCERVEESLQGLAREGYRRAVVRAFNAAYHAWDWGFLRRDPNPDELLLSALMHDAAELALWVNAPDRIHALRRLVYRDHVPPAEAQYIALGESLEHFGRRLAERWNLPPLVHEALRPEYSHEPRVQGVVLAVELVRESQWGWYSPPVEETLERIGEHLDGSLGEVSRHVHAAAVRAAREADFHGAAPPASLLPLQPGGEQYFIDAEFPPEAGAEPSNAQAAVCLSPQPARFDEIVQQMEQGLGRLESNDLLRLAIHGMHEGAGLNRVVFAILSNDRRYLQARFMVGSDSDSRFNRFRIALDRPHLFTRLMEKPQSLRLHPGNRDKFWPLVPAEVQALIGTDSFFVQSVHINGRPVGLFYADRHGPDCDMDQATYDKFRQLCRLATQGMMLNARRQASKGATA